MADIHERFTVENLDKVEVRALWDISADDPAVIDHGPNYIIREIYTTSEELTQGLRLHLPQGDLMLKRLNKPDSKEAEFQVIEPD